ncbi:hypothetical protein SMAC4_08016 [Sordaria macrospora]|uniref:WGS project CABT00000000 data, contig 2.13 n=1 Tax=Sordaria macrospora (strain ATCC MYA-333 / DSM 997 / K(L3346) / K-hell) TaxID=771870 RepID=F7VY69_SORMK|nr:uncharacterized protein SMAC_08016 [Sordaria macrospora k-hell]WPJ62905.1 hypothetical protein SMAC4_08016 [Sordaria macrospora]CCC10463.1 unnamed protein product [Sordaria macrospora k-hell]
MKDTNGSMNGGPQGPVPTLDGLNNINGINGYSKKTANGYNSSNAVTGINGINGPIKPTLSHSASPRVTPRQRPRSRPGVITRTFNVVARLVTWYTILTVLFRCPASLKECDKSSPRICETYFEVKQTVLPRVEPYYTAYAAPYVDLARPYYHVIDQKAIAPALAYAQPRITKAQAYTKTQWQKTLQPQLVKYQKLAKTHYEQSVGPHVKQLSTAAGPYYEIARTNALQTYHGVVVPSYHYVEPYAHKGYKATSAFAASTVLPSTRWAWHKTSLFLDGTVMPHLRVIYSENVEPQLLKIGQRLGRHTTSNKKSVPKPPVDLSSSKTSTFSKPTPATTAASTPSSHAESTFKAAAAEEQKVLNSESTEQHVPENRIPPPEVDEQLEKEDPARRSARETVAADLQDWQERYSKAADQGASEISARIYEITKKMIRRNAKVTGKALLDELQTTTVSELVQLRRKIIQITGAVNKESASVDEGRDQITAVVRQAGMSIKERAQEVRTWRENYEAEMQSAITNAAEAHFTILGDIRDLALQKLGMKWAWMDGVTYKDWAKYHELKTRFEDWNNDLKNLIVTHPGLEAAQNEAAAVEEEAMNTAASAAKELARLKQVAVRKLEAGDDSDEFESTVAQQAAEHVEYAQDAAASVISQASESVSAAGEKVSEVVGDGVSRAADVVSEATEAVVGAKDSATDKMEELADEATSPVVKAASSASESVESATFVVKQSAAAVLSEGSEAIAGSSTVTQAVESTSVASKKVADVVESASEAASTVESRPNLASTEILEETPVMVGNTTEAEKEGPAPVKLPVEEEAEEESDIIVSEVAEPPATTVKSAWLGAAAQSVPTRQPIIDEDTYDDVSEAMEKMRNDVKSVYSSAMSRANNQYSEALKLISAQIRGTPEPAHEQMLASVTQAYSKAMASASVRLDKALKGASKQIYKSTPTETFKILPTAVPVPNIPSVDWERIQSIAAQRLEQGQSWAAEQYESAKIAAGLATPTPSTPSEHVQKALENARHNYYAGLGVAHARYSEFLSAASSALNSLTATPTPTDLAGTASSVASVATESAASAASVVTDNAAYAASVASENVADAASAAAASASSVASAVTDGAASAASVVGENASSIVYAAGDKASSAASVVSENVADAASVVSENVADAASVVSESWDSVLARISIEVYGAPTPTPWYQTVLSAANAASASAVSVANQYGDAASDAAADNAASITSAAGAAATAAGQYAAAGSDAAAQQYSVVSSIVSELLVGKEPTFSESVVSRLHGVYATSLPDVVVGAYESASSLAREAKESVVSVASQASEAVVAGHDEL